MSSKKFRREVSGVLLLDKPLGLSSNQALQRVKRLFAAAKAGHTGSLDPLATGLLPLCFGQATKISSYLLDADKRYVARIRFGEKTETGDAEGAITVRSDPALLTRQALEAAIQLFIGPIRQMPPMYSALKRNGEPLYRLARQGIEVEREPRDIAIRNISLTAYGDRECELDVTCSKGTYIRTLAEDIAAAAGQCAHLSALRRLELGTFRDVRMYTLETLEKLAEVGPQALDACLIDAASALPHWPRLRLTPDQVMSLSRGRSLELMDLPAAGKSLALLDDKGRLVGLGEVAVGSILTPKRWLGGVN